MTITREAAGTVLSELDFHIRAAGKTPPNTESKPAAKGKPAAVPQDDDEAGEQTNVPLPTAEDTDEGDIPQDPAEVKDLILGEISEQLDWDMQSGDPNESLAELEDSLADMFDADVEITWNGENAFTLRVEGEEPMPLTVDTLGELLELLAKGGGADGGEEEPEDDAAERGHVSWERGRNLFGGGGNFDESKVNRDPGGEGGGRFIKKGTTAAGAVAGAVKTGAGKTGAGKTGASKTGPGKTGPSKAGPGRMSKLVARVKPDKMGPRAAAKAVGNVLGKATGRRQKVSGNKDGTFNVGPQKKKMTGKKVAAIMLSAWLAFTAAATAVIFTASLVGAPAGFASAVTSAASIGMIIKIIRDVKNA